MSALQELERRALLLKRRIRTTGRPLTPAERAEVTTESAAIRQGIANAMTERLVEQRPELISRGQPAASVTMKRGIDEARTRLHAKPEFRKRESRCPAATVIPRVDGEVVVCCGVEGTQLTSGADPQSVLTFCLGNHLACPSWIAEKEALAAGRDLQAEVGAA